MNAKVYKKETNYQVWFKGNWTTHKTEKEAIEKAFELDFDFYSKNKDKLPKGITIDISEKRFRLFIRLDHKRMKVIKSGKNLQDLIDIRKHILINLLDLF